MTALLAECYGLTLLTHLGLLVCCQTLFLGMTAVPGAWQQQLSKELLQNYAHAGKLTQHADSHLKLRTEAVADAIDWDIIQGASVLPLCSS